MRILIDMQGAQSASRFRGIGRYSLSLALAIARNARHHDIWLILNGAFPESILSIRHAFKGLIPPERLRVFEVPKPVAECDPNNAWRTRAAEKIREHFIQQLKPDVLHVSSFFEGYVDDAVTSIDKLPKNIFTVVTFYDLIPMLNQPDYLANQVQKESYFRKLDSLKNADLLLAISDSSKQEAIDGLKFPSSKVVNISAAADERFKKVFLSTERVSELKGRYGIQRKMVMYAPGGFDQRKNFEGLISAYSMISLELREQHQLIIVGNIGADRRAHLEKLAEANGLAQEEMVITGYLSENELIEFYSLATLFVFPSKHEGFGLPALEAMACGVPVIGSNVTSIPEVIGLADALFDPNSPKEISKKIAKVLSDESFMYKLASHGLDQARKFSWDESARRVISAFELHVQVAKSQVNLNCEDEKLTGLLEDISIISQARPPSQQDIISLAECISFNQSGKMQKQLLLDISELVQRDAKSGIQRVVRSILKELVSNPPSDKDIRPIYFDGRSYKYANKFFAKFIGDTDAEKVDDIVDFCQDDIYLALDLNAHLTKAIHNFHMRLKCLGIRMYFIVYDIMLVQHPEWWPQGTNVIFEAWLKSISEVSTGLICISEAVAEEVLAWLKQNPMERVDEPIVSSFHLGADIENSLPSKGMPDTAHEVLASLKLKPSFLMVGTIEPRKGHAQTLAAFELLWEQGVEVNLVIVGKRGWLVEQIVEKLNRHPEFNKRLFWLEGISDEYLEKIYATCDSLIAASEGEGFGLPLIEAAQHKKPIIARDIPVFREVAGEHAYYFDAKDGSQLAKSVEQWLSIYKAGLHPKSDEMPWLTWNESTAQMLKSIL